MQYPMIKILDIEIVAQALSASTLWTNCTVPHRWTSWVADGLRVAFKFVWIYNRLGISFMQVSKWGNSLAVRLPAVVVEALDLKEGDEIEISIASKRDFKVARDRS